MKEKLQVKFSHLILISIDLYIHINLKNLFYLDKY